MLGLVGYGVPGLVGYDLLGLVGCGFVVIGAAAVGSAHGAKSGWGSSMQSTRGLVAVTASMTRGCAWSSNASLAQMIPAKDVFRISVSCSVKES